MHRLFYVILPHLLFLFTLAQNSEIENGNYTIALLVRNGNFSGWLSMDSSDTQPKVPIFAVDHRDPSFTPTIVSQMAIVISTKFANDLIT